jgi:ankyrin repeat protein
MQMMTKQMIAIIGPDTPEDAAYIGVTWKKAGLSNEIVGDGERFLTPGEIRKALAKSSDFTQIHYSGHGNIVRYSNKTYAHRIHLLKDFDYTAKILSADKDRPGIRHLWSCHGGAAKYAVKKLGENRPLIIHSGKKYSTLSAMSPEEIAAHGEFCQHMLQNHQRMPNAQEVFEFSMLTSPETVIFSQLVSGKVKSFKGSATRKPTGKEGLRIYLEAQIKEFRKFRQKEFGHNEKDFLNINKILTDKVLSRYLEHAMLVEASRDDSKHNTEYVKAYLKAGLDPNCASSNGTTALLLSCAGNVETVSLLLENGAGANLADDDGRTPLYTACENRHIEAIKLLLKHKDIDVNKASNGGFTPLYIACEEGHTGAIELLLKQKNIKVNQTNNNGTTPLYIACEEGHTGAIELLLKHKDIDVNKVNDDGFTPLDIACQKGHIKAIELLLKSGADINKGLYNTFTPLMVAALCGKGDVVDLLLEHIKDSTYLEKITDTKIAEDFCVANKITMPQAHRNLLWKSAADMARDAGHAAIADKIEARYKLLDVISKNKTLDITYEKKGNVSVACLTHLDGGLLNKRDQGKIIKKFQSEIKSGQLCPREHTHHGKVTGYSLRSPRDKAEQQTWATKHQNRAEPLRSLD